jgi:maleate cis-trans isomerase
VQATNQLEVNYLSETGYTVLHELGLALEPHAYSAVTPEEWKEVVKDNLRADADGYFLSCTNTRMIEAIADLENDLGKPVVNSNQATIWVCLKKLGNHTQRPTPRTIIQFKLAAAQSEGPTRQATFLSDRYFYFPPEHCESPWRELYGCRRR